MSRIELIKFYLITLHTTRKFENVLRLFGHTESTTNSYSNYNVSVDNTDRQTDLKEKCTAALNLTSNKAFNICMSYNYESTKNGGKTSSETSSTTTSTQNTGSDIAQRPGEVRTWIDDLNSPLVQNDGDNKHLKLRFDVSQYAPEEIVVKTVDNKLLVHAKHEEKTESKSVYREYNREFLLPKGTNPEQIKSSLSKDGVLTVEAPLPAITSGETYIPIQH